MDSPIDLPIDPALRGIVAARDALRNESFSFEHEGATYVWNVTKALVLIAAKPREPDFFRPADQGVTAAHLRERYPSLDWEYARTADLTTPLLFVPYQGRAQMIDGWHRLARAVLENVPELPAYLLTQQEADKCLVLHLPPGTQKKGDSL